MANREMFLVRQSAFYCIDLYDEKPVMLLFPSGMITWKGKGFVRRFYSLGILFPSVDLVVSAGTCAEIRIEEGDDLLSIRIVKKNVKCDLEIYQKENKK